MPDVTIYRVRPQPGGPSMCLKGQSYEERLAKEAVRSPATRGSKKNCDRAMTPATEAVRVLPHFAPPGFLQDEKLHNLHAQSSLGQNCHRPKKKKRKKTILGLCTHGRFSPTLCNHVDCGLPGFSVREGCSPGKNTGAYWSILVAILF